MQRKNNESILGQYLISNACSDWPIGTYSKAGAINWI